MPKLIVEKGADRGGEIEISPTGSIIVGRETSTGFRLRDSWASRQHFRIEQRNGDSFWLVDLKSLNGTYVNGKRVTELRLSYGDLIKVGETLFTFIGDGAKDPLIGQRLAGYRIVERVGRGGMGTVYRAEQIDLQRTVAVKVISPEYAKNREFIERFINEARAAAQLNHPNVVQVYDVKRDGKVYFFSMEFMDNGSLQTILGPVKKLPPKQAIKMILDAARGLEYAHAKEIVHRDIKPDNMMVGDTGAVKIGDLGLAAGLHERATNEEERYVLGTPHYIAPEQLLGKPADFRSDIYSLGSSLYRLLAGQPPFSGHGVQEIVNKKVREDPVRVEQLVPGLPAPIAKVTSRMIERDPEKRFQTMTEAVEALEDIHDQMRSGDKSTVRRAAAAADGEAPAWRKPAVLGAAAGVLALLLAVLGWAIFGPGDDGGGGKAGNGGGGVIVKENPDTLLRLADLEAEKVSDASPAAQIEAVIGMYDEIVVEFPGSPQAVKAEGKKSDLTLILETVTRTGAVQAAVDYDAAQWNLFEENFAEGTVDTEPIRLALERYREVAASPKYQNTYVAIDASDRAAHIAKWLEDFEAMRARYGEAELEMTQLGEQGHWGDARGPMEAFVERYEPFGKWRFDEERYIDLFWGRVAKERMDRFQKEAEGAFRTFESTVRALAPRGKFDEARELLEARKSDFDFLQAYGMLVKDIEQREKDYAASQAAKAAEEHQQRLREDRAEFDRATRQAYESHAREFRFLDAYHALEALEPKLRTEEVRALLQERLKHLERAGDHVLAFGNAAFDAGTFIWPDIKTGGVSFKDRRILGADADKFRVESGGVGDLVINKAFRDFIGAPWDFLAVLRTWPQGPPEDLAFVAVEIGEYEAAAALLKDVDTPTAAAYRAALAALDLVQSREEQAARRFTRIEALMRAERYEEAAADLIILQTRFTGTSVLFERGATLKAWETEIEQRIGLRMEEQRRLRSLERAAQVRAASDERIKSREKAVEDAVRRAVGNSALAFEGQMIRGLYEYGRYMLPPAKRALEQSAQLARERRPSDDNQAERGLLANMFLCEVEAVSSNREPILRRVETYVEARIDKVPTYYENWIKEDFVAWYKELREFDRESIDSRLGQLERDARDPKLIWETARDLVRYARRFAEARGWLELLMEEEFADFEAVKNGDALYLLAECDLFLFDLGRARQAYKDLQNNHPRHPKNDSRVHADNASVRLELVKYLTETLNLEDKEP